MRKNVYKEKDWVWYYYPRKFTSKSPKWQRNFTGPYRVVRVIPPVNYVLQRSRRSKPFVVHADKLKKYHSPPAIDWALSGDVGEQEAEPEMPSMPASLPAPVQSSSREKRSRPAVSEVHEDSKVEGSASSRTSRDKETPLPRRVCMSVSVSIRYDAVFVL